MSETYVEQGAKTQRLVDWRHTALKVLIGVLVVFLMAEFAFYLLVVPATSLVRLTVNGSTSVGHDQMCSLAGISGNERWIHINSASIAANLARQPLFESVTVEKQFPDKLVISVVERVPVAIALGTVGDTTVPVSIDASGIVFRVGAYPSNESLPLITGLQIDDPVAGMRLHTGLKPLLSQLRDLESRNSVLLSSISEIKIEEKTYGGFDLVIYPVHTPVRVRTDKALNEDALQYMMLVLDVVQELALDVEEIDIRAGTVAYRLREV